MAPKVMLLAIATMILGKTAFDQAFDSAFGAQKEPSDRERIMEATVIISLFVPKLEKETPVDEAFPIPANDYRQLVRPEMYFKTDGLGTLLNSGDEILLVTHDHWSQFDSILGIVQIRDASGAELAEMELKDFKKRIRYRDGGTMIVDISIKLDSGSGLIGSLLPDAHDVYRDAAAGDKVLLTHQNQAGEAGVTLIEATVEEIGVKEGKPVVGLRAAGGETIVSGDSGGGVWIQGRLAGNMWATIIAEDELTGARRLTTASVAALYPLDALASAGRLVHEVGQEPVLYEAGQISAASEPRGEESTSSCAEAAPDARALCQEMEQHILDSTLRIDIKSWIMYVEGEGYTRLHGTGHGTVKDGRYLITHNHYGEQLTEILSDRAASEALTVTLFRANGEQLMRIPGNSMKVTNVDAETLLFDFGEGVFPELGVASAAFEEWQSLSLQPGMEVAQLNWDWSQAHVDWVRIDAVTTQEGVPVLQLANCLDYGASGGGVFWQGVHVANNWNRDADCASEAATDAGSFSRAALNSEWVN